MNLREKGEGNGQRVPPEPGPVNMDNEPTPPPFDALMTQLGLTNADLVKASTDQLTFKMVQKGRKGRRLTINGQEKILRALLTLKPDLKTVRQDLF